MATTRTVAIHDAHNLYPLIVPEVLIFETEAIGLATGILGRTNYEEVACIGTKPGKTA